MPLVTRNRPDVCCLLPAPDDVLVMRPYCSTPVLPCFSPEVHKGTLVQVRITDCERGRGVRFTFNNCHDFPLLFQRWQNRCHGPGCTATYAFFQSLRFLPRARERFACFALDVSGSQQLDLDADIVDSLLLISSLVRGWYPP